MERNDLKSRFVSALLGSMLAVGIAGAGMAYAQTADDTPETTVPAQEAPAEDAPAAPDEDCPEKNGAASGRGTPTTPAPSADEA